MKTTSLSRRAFVSGAAAVTAAYAPFSQAQSQADTSGVQKFLSQWDQAWANHDAHALSLLVTEGIVTVNRFGTLIPGREALQKALAFLHGESGPFGHAKFPPLTISVLRKIAEGVMIVQANWQNPVMNPDGKIDPVKVSDMIVTIVLVKDGEQWKATEMDLHNVEKMDLPYSQPGQKK